MSTALCIWSAPARCTPAFSWFFLSYDLAVADFCLTQDVAQISVPSEAEQRFLLELFLFRGVDV